VSDSGELPLPALLVGKLFRLLVRVAWRLAYSIATSVVAALILLIGVNTVLGFGLFGLSFLRAVLKTAINLVIVLVGSALLSCIVLIAVTGGSAYVARWGITAVQRRRLNRVQRRLRTTVRRMRRFYRNRSEAEAGAAVAQVLVAMTLLFTCGYVTMRDPKSWNATLRVRMPTGVPVGRVGRSEKSPQVSRLTDVPNYLNARRDKVEAKLKAITQLIRAQRDVPITSRCGVVLPLRPAEAHVLSELYVDLAETPPLVKHDYVLTEEQLTSTLSMVLAAEDAGFTLDCVKMHRNNIRFFTTSKNDDGETENHSVGFSVAKEGGSSSMVLDEFSRGRASFEVGWLGLGAMGDRGGFVNGAEGAEQFEEILRSVDSHVFSVNVFEGYLHIVTWRLPSVVAARAAVDVGYAQCAIQHRVEPREDAAALGVIGKGDLVYVLERHDEWLYVCSEVSGRLGWIPKASFTSLELSTTLTPQPITKDGRYEAPQQFLGAKSAAANAIAPQRFSFADAAWLCQVSADGSGLCREARTKWKFRLPVDGGRIDSLYVNSSDTLVLAYSLTHTKTGGGKLAGIRPRARRPLWTIDVSQNLAVPIASRESVLVAAPAFVASVNRMTGSFQWRHEFAGGRSDETVPQLSLENNVAHVVPTQTDRIRGVASVCFDFVTGSLVACPSTSVP